MDKVDMVVVGSGPAGTAAAIWAALAGLRVSLYERSAEPRHRPGESLHPGVGAILRQLGVEEQVSLVSRVRHLCVTVNWGGHQRRSFFGGDSTGPWRGYQIARAELDAILLHRAREVGVEVVQSTAVATALLEGERVCGVRLPGDGVQARFVVDATGRGGWLQRFRGLKQHFRSPRLRVYYGYCSGAIAQLAESPHMQGDGDGWAWVAQVEPEKIAWVRLRFDGRKVLSPPPLLDGCPEIGRTRGADATWQRTDAAGPGFFLAGDAAMALDPAASNGVLRGLMSGIMIGHLVQRVLSGELAEQEARKGYNRWISAWFEADSQRLARMYDRLQPTWAHRPHHHAHGCQ